MADTNASKASPREIEIIRGAYRKLDNMPLSFGIPSYSDAMSDADVERYMYGDLRDTLRELKLANGNGIIDMSNEELHVENRIVYHALRRFRNSASTFFKFSTATDGKTIDKQMIPKMLMTMIGEYDAEFKSWRKTLSPGALWSMQSTVQTNGNYDSSSS